MANETVAATYAHRVNRGMIEWPTKLLRPHMHTFLRFCIRRIWQTTQSLNRIPPKHHCRARLACDGRHGETRRDTAGHPSESLASQRVDIPP